MSETTMMEDISLFVRAVEGIPILVLITIFLIVSYFFRSETLL